MPGLDPGIHVFGGKINKDVDARHKAGHDQRNGPRFEMSRSYFFARKNM
jgi:hypothetical protein